MDRPSLTPELLRRLMQAKSSEERGLILGGGTPSSLVRRSMSARSVDANSSDDGTAERRRYARALQRRLDKPLVRTGDDTQAERLLHAARLRAKHAIAKPDPRSVAATSQFRMRGGW